MRLLLQPPRRLLLAAALALTLSGAGESATEEFIFQDSFREGLAEGWSWLREDPGQWRTGARGLEVRIQPGNMWGRANNAKNVLLRAVPTPGDSPIEIAAVLHHEPTGQWEQADLVWFCDEANMVKLGQELVSGKLCVVMGREESDKTRTIGIVPLDDHTVELRLLIGATRIHGQYRTAHWPAWREVGDCPPPVNGTPRLSLQCYQGPPDAPHWARWERVTIRRLATLPSTLAEERAQERPWRSGQPASAALARPEDSPNFVLENLVAQPDALGGKSDAEQNIFVQRDGTYGWNWDRRQIATAKPNRPGMAMTRDPTSGLVFPLPLASINTLEAEMDVIARLDVDRGQHNLSLQLLVSDSPVSGQGHPHRLSICFDWQGPAATGTGVSDGFRSYVRVAASPSTAGEPPEHAYRLAGLRGAPPRVNLKALLDDAADWIGMTRSSLHLWGLRLGNEVWNNSKGRTVVRRLDWILNGRRCATVPARVETSRP